MTQHISSVAKACYFHLRQIQQVKRCLDETCFRILIQALVISRLDYCNSVLSGLPSSTLQPLSSVLHTAARLIKDLGPRDHIASSGKTESSMPVTWSMASLAYEWVHYIRSSSP